MSFIRVRKLVRDEKGKVVSGSAALVESQYSKGTKYHSKQKEIEKLGKIIEIDGKGRKGLFLSPTRGLVDFDADTGVFTPVGRDDPRVAGTGLFSEPEVHTVFGDAYLLLSFLGKTGMADVLAKAFPDRNERERLLCHIVHGVMRDGSKITCEDFIAKSFASYLFPDVPLATLKSDTEFYSLMGKDSSRMAFFKEFVSVMRQKDPSFGKGCYVDSTPLPNDIADNPFNALCCHGVSSSSLQERLVLVLDEKNGLPVWYDIIPGNLLDVSTISNVMEDVAKSLGVVIDSMVLDAGYVSKELIGMAHVGTEKTVIARMPARKGYPYNRLYQRVKTLIGKGKHECVINGRTYFAKREEVEIFGQKEHAYVYVDHYNAMSRFRDYLLEHGEEYAAMKNSQKDWMTVKYGFFVLISNLDKGPAEILADYFGRTEIETVFKTSKDFLAILPLSKWTDQTVRGKILHDIIDTIVLLQIRKIINPSGISTTELAGKTQSLICLRKGDTVIVDPAGKQVKEYYDLLGIELPSSVRISGFLADKLKLGV